MSDEIIKVWKSEYDKLKAWRGSVRDAFVPMNEIDCGDYYEIKTEDWERLSGAICSDLTISDFNDFYRRKEFEDWIDPDGKYPQSVERSGDGYKFMQTRNLWTAWKKRGSL